MITDFLISMVGGLIRGFFGMVGQCDCGVGAISTAGNGITNALSINGWLPVQFIFSALLVIVVIRLWFLVFNMVVWIYHQIPFNG